MPAQGAVLAGIAEVAPGVPLIGCSSSSAIHTQGPKAEGVVVTALGGAGISARTALGRDAEVGRREAGAAAARFAGGLAEWGYRILLLLSGGQVHDTYAGLAR